jgi:hypothetical protein
VLDRAREIVSEYDDAMTLRQLFYRLVSEELLPNNTSSYNTLSGHTAEARRAGTFPTLVDRTRKIDRPRTFADPDEAKRWLREIYCRDRTEGQAESVYLGVEKDALAGLLSSWFEEYGLPVVALRGYASQTLADDVAADIGRQNRPAVLLYAGDHDASGDDIVRDFTARVARFEDVVRVALTAEQVEEYDLPPLPGKTTDSRMRGFAARHGRIIQVEVDALPPDALRDLFASALGPYLDLSKFRSCLAREERDRAELGH